MIQNTSGIGRIKDFSITLPSFQELSLRIYMVEGRVMFCCKKEGRKETLYLSTAKKQSWLNNCNRTGLCCKELFGSFIVSLLSLIR